MFCVSESKPNLSAHSDIKIEDGDTDRRKLKSGYRLLQLFRRIKRKSSMNVLPFYILLLLQNN